MLKRYVFLFVVIAALLLVACGGSAASPTPTKLPLSAAAVAGQMVFRQECGACHDTAADTVIVGPSLVGIAARAGARVPGQDAQTYLLTSILRPGEYVVAGFEELMPTNFGKKLTGEEIDAIVAYLLTLENGD